MDVCLFQWEFEIRRREHGPKFDATGAGAKHAWSRCAYFPLGKKMPGSHTGDAGCTAVDLHMLQHLGGPSIIVPAWSRPNFLCPCSPHLAAAAAHSTSVMADEPWPQPAQQQASPMAIKDAGQR